eukprot:TRINITY_DN56_c0_g1_i12.p2 TRINITY_DN56_c0_g1~~TRINITY_DN56_c0_g1_i12.p2  ORF type:complete len:808 (+),score=368.87 TRINITY_DN56_c0_g1_i12:843-3266(+)
MRYLVNKYQSLEVPDYINMCQCLIYLDDPDQVATVLGNLLHGGEGDELLSYQIAFDLCDTATQKFNLRVREVLHSKQTEFQSSSSAAGEGEGEAEQDAKSEEEDNDAKEFQGRLKKLVTILKGETSINLYLSFLCRNNKTDVRIMNNTKDALEVKNSVLNLAAVLCNGIMYSGTTVDTFLRKNMQWLARCKNWAQFSAVASLGMIHFGHMSEGQKVLTPYLPGGGGNGGSDFAAGGSLYAVGLMHANHSRAETIDYMSAQLDQAAGKEPVMHGACLGLGAAAMATGNETVTKQLRNILYSDNAVAGEAAALAIGLVNVGTADEMLLNDFLGTANNTEHEKISRAIGLAFALINYGREEEADVMIEQLCTDKDPIMRYGGMYTIALAYCGTRHNKALRRLLHFAVSDVNDDVRRAAVTAIGFLLFREPKLCPKFVALLAKSYNPHVRHGAAMALGIACAGTGLKEAVDMLMVLTEDKEDFVRQGALIALAMILMQLNEKQEPKVKEVRDLFAKIISNKREPTMAKLGAIFATGLIDAGGRNVTISLLTRTGHKNMPAIVGLAMFTQFWNWYPFTHFISMAFSPTALIGLNRDLKVPKTEFISQATPSTFAYPEPIKAPETDKKKKVEKAVLSFTNKARNQDGKLASESNTLQSALSEVKGGEAMETEDADGNGEEASEKKEGDEKKGEDKDAMEVEDKENKGKGKAVESEEQETEAEPEFEELSNPSRVTLNQRQFIRFQDTARYEPAVEGYVFGITMLMDNTPEEPEELADIVVTGVQGSKSGSSSSSANDEDEGEEPPPPADFNWP